MAKKPKKRKVHQTMMKASESVVPDEEPMVHDEEPVVPDKELPRIKYNQPSSSPYELPIVTITIGNKVYGIPKYYIHKVPRLANRLFSGNPKIVLLDIDEDIGHTLVHFLYSGSYETITSPLDRGIASIAREYRRSVLVYKAARTYDMPDLEAFARKYIEHFGETLSLFDVLRATKEVFSKLPEDESWLPLYIKQKLEQSFMVDKSIFTNDGFFGVLGEDCYFSNTIFKMVFDIYSTRLQLLESELTHKVSMNGHLDIERTGPESPVAKHDPEEYPADDYPEDASPAGGAPEPVPSEPYPEDDAPEEPIDVPLSPAEPISVGDYAEGPAAEPSPVEDYPPEPAPSEPHPEDYALEMPAEESSSPSQPYFPQKSTAANLIANISLYNDWETLSKKEKIKTRTKLRNMGLPVPT